MALASPQIPAADLRRWLAQMEAHGRAPAAVLPFDIAEVDAHMPGGGLALGHFHEVIEGGAASEFAGSRNVVCRRDRSAHPWAGPVVPTRPRSLCAGARAYRPRS